MPAIRLPRPKTGITRLDDALSRYADAAEAALNLSVSPPLVAELTPAGWVISKPPRVRMDVRLTSAGSTPGSYNAAQVYPSAGGGWTPYPAASGWSGLAWEKNLFASVTLPAVVEVFYYANTDTYRFELGGCP